METLYEKINGANIYQTNGAKYINLSDKVIEGRCSSYCFGNVEDDDLPCDPCPQDDND
jgi:hypothetical protein